MCAGVQVCMCGLTLSPCRQVEDGEGHHEDEHWTHHTEEVTDDTPLSFRTTNTQTNK